MSEFEKGRKAFQRDLNHQPYADPTYLTNVGLSVVADGLAELIALLRPAVSTLTTPPGPLVPAAGPTCFALPSGVKDATKSCVKDRGHDGMHTGYLGTLWDDAEPDPEQPARLP